MTVHIANLTTLNEKIGKNVNKKGPSVRGNKPKVFYQKANSVLKSAQQRIVAQTAQ